MVLSYNSTVFTLKGFKVVKVDALYESPFVPCSTCAMLIMMFILMTWYQRLNVVAWPVILAKEKLHKIAILPMYQLQVWKHKYKTCTEMTKGKQVPNEDDFKYHQKHLYMKVLVAQSCPTLCNLMDCSAPGSSMEFSRQEYWSGLPFPLQGIFLTQRSNPILQHYRQFLYSLSCQGSPSLYNTV